MAESRSPWAPPADVTPERLFRRLLRRPRPWAPVPYQFPGTTIPLHVRALTPYEAACAMDVDVPEAPQAALADQALAGLVVASLYEPGGPAFASADQAGRMPQREWARLMTASLTALYGVMPSRQFCKDADWQEWTKALTKGAQHPSNLTETIRLAACHDISVGFAGVARKRRPDRYFGLPDADLTEGQQMAFDAAFNFIENLRQKHK